MKKGLRFKWMRWTGVIVGILAVWIGFESYKQTGSIDYKEIMALIIASFALFAIFINFIFSNKSSGEFTLFKNDINERLKIFDTKLIEIEDVVTIITKQDIEDSKKRVKYFNMITDINETIQTEKKIYALGQKIKRESKKLINKIYNLNEYIKSTLIEICNQVSEIIIKDYNYGLEDFHLIDYETDIRNKINIIIDSLDPIKINNSVKIEISKSINDNIDLYKENILGLKGFENGERQKTFDHETMLFIELIIEHVEKIKIPKKEKA
jgi:hypothetical protein